MDKNKVLFLVESDPSNIFINDLKTNGYNVELFFKEKNVALRALRRLCINTNPSYSTIWFGNWFNELDKYEYLIINVNRLNHKLFNEILKKKPDIKIIGWYWNTVDDSNYPIDYQNPNIEYWSFDENDCNKYGFKKNIQYYSEPKIDNVEKTLDIYFVGRDKGRKEIINEFKNKAESQGLKCDFNIVGNDIIPYSEAKKYIAKSKAVLEINKENQSGFTLRTLESLFFGVKLITNNKHIKNSDIYNKNNVFIIEEDNINELKEFINKEFDHSVDNLKEKYNINAWFNNFFKENC